MSFYKSESNLVYKIKTLTQCNYLKYLFTGWGLENV